MARWIDYIDIEDANGIVQTRTILNTNQYDYEPDEYDDKYDKLVVSGMKVA